MNAILEVNRLEKRYGALRALDGVSFSVAKGEVFALLGPNGAGKTTALEIMEGIRKADGGSVSVCGVDALARPDRALRHLGVQLQTQGLPASMTVSEALDFFSLYRKRAPRPGVLERFGLAGRRKAAYGSLSVGYQRRLMLALAVAHSPEIVVLDEPTAGLDVESRNALHELIREEKAGGVTVILASHDMAEVEKLADRAAVLVRGRMAAVGSPRQLTSRGDTQTRLSVLTRDGSLSGGIAGWGGTVDAEGYLRLRADKPGPLLSRMLAQAEAAGDEILDLRVERPSLEERFLELAGRGGN